MPYSQREKKKFIKMLNRKIALLVKRDELVVKGP